MQQINSNDDIYQTFTYDGKRLPNSNVLEFHLPQALNTEDNSWLVAVVGASLPTRLIIIPEHDIKLYLMVPGEETTGRQSSFQWRKKLTIR